MSARNAAILKMPFLYVNDTFNLQVLNLLQKMTKITFHHRQLHWSDRKGLEKCHITVYLNHTN